MSTTANRTLKVIDSHTEGEPTRIVIEGGPDLSGMSWDERVKFMEHEGDWIRSATCNEPRGHEAMVGAVLCDPIAEDCVTGVLFFNNVGLLNMCIHATIGLAQTLVHQGKIGVGRHRIDTRVGVVTAEVHKDGRITVENVPSYRKEAGVSLEVEGFGEVVGDISWGGNWFFLIDGYGPEVSFSNLDELTHFCWEVRKELGNRGITGDKGMEIDHVETFGPPESNAADSKNFVLCPGKAYDRSPCGTGTSAKLAALYQAGKLREGEVWRQASILNTVFEGRVELRGEDIIPIVTGRAWVNGESTLILDPSDPFCEGIRFKKPHIETEL